MKKKIKELNAKVKNLESENVAKNETIEKLNRKIENLEQRMPTFDLFIDETNKRNLEIKMQIQKLEEYNFSNDLKCVVATQKLNSIALQQNNFIKDNDEKDVKINEIKSIVENFEKNMNRVIEKQNKTDSIFDVIKTAQTKIDNLYLRLPKIIFSTKNSGFEISGEGKIAKCISKMFINHMLYTTPSFSSGFHIFQIKVEASNNIVLGIEGGNHCETWDFNNIKLDGKKTEVSKNQTVTFTFDFFNMKFKLNANEFTGTRSLENGKYVIYAELFDIDDKLTIIE